MKFNELTNGLSRAVHKAAFGLRKKSPEILIGLGLLGGAATVVMGCWASFKAAKKMEAYKLEMDLLEKGKYLPEDIQTDVETDKKGLRVWLAKELALCYGPTVATGLLSAAAIVTGHDIQKKRLLALSAAYAALDDGFRAYRKRVEEQLGGDKERALLYDPAEKGETDGKGVEKAPFGCSPNAAVFDESSVYYQEDYSYNRMFIVSQEDYANRLLEREGHLFLNKAREMLGLPPTRAGQTLGWLWDKDAVHKVSFGFYELNREEDEDGEEFLRRSPILLDFNVDGNILCALS